MAQEPVWNQKLIFKIKEHLYLGTSGLGFDEKSLKEHKIDFAINCTAVESNIKSIDTEWLNLTDEETTQIDKCFEKTNEIIKKTIDSKKNILVFCNSAVSRSVTIMCAFLISQGMTLDDALNYIEEKKQGRKAEPNPSFLKQLQNFERNLKNNDKNEANDSKKDA